ncbi:hypothetical protein HY772_09710 [Candidatus Woesearchaeota archaeon]|nr:hypothetical protein [Candidatus Woesearchaeota archaeon]
MKKAISIIGIFMVMAILIVSSLAVAGETPDSRHDSAQTVSADNQFSALNGIQAEKMNNGEMNKVVGKALPEPIPFIGRLFVYRTYFVYGR